MMRDHRENCSGQSRFEAKVSKCIRPSIVRSVTRLIKQMLMTSFNALSPESSLELLQ